jgi:hypothetical protein
MSGTRLAGSTARQVFCVQGGRTHVGSVEKSHQRRSLPPSERLRVYALKRFEAHTRRQVANFRCSRTHGTLSAKKWRRPCFRAASGQVWMDPSERLRACFFEPPPSLCQAAWLWANWLLEFSIIQHSHVGKEQRVVEQICPHTSDYGAF